MGFEQLASLRDQLARDAAQKRAVTKPQKRDAKPATAPSSTDPVVLTIAKLQKRFPQAFPRNPAPKVPLKVGILEDLVGRASELRLTEAELRDAMRTWCQGNRYWTCLVEDAVRVDLAGGEAGRVSAADAKRARMLKGRRPAKPRAQSAKPEQTRQQQPTSACPPQGEQHTD
ncbi:ProQ/FinO family protein [Burkholderia thailandensis]|uniref:ProP effector n=1 Tax=Burkholderia thailandensis (strain ATCC 700388 / DSM 13276 / CCUG 48851 / CIP 106301 / E264) TaxID=271848 RepID=Q2T5N0_BURTA|nr:ProQ/FinO family protein [Burkholderia thailandensis]ABC35998.1 ProP effector [Burkholderia thailandensis E264]AHI75832.1 proQ/FINO family protein [Burkholderia thailandensis 2002721723]AHI81438.1 proQ/FINO family protein [Burkholderia thailandensis E444]AIC90478.1 proQ/FINO family protein [Burkholderia thailandensis USAMRU Malaysia \